MAVRTLLVGLGGSGCQVVARVKNLIGTTEPNVQFIGFDTDNDGKGCEGLTVIQTSREMIIEDYLKDVPGWQEWFPDNPMLHAKNMIKGAGQVRPASRLAFAETVSSGRIGKLEQAIRQLQVSRGDVKPSNFRIMIVSSFAGGTGSGMFLQTAMFLRDYIRKNYGGEVIIRGMFAMPDLFMSVNPSPLQRESMYANAYAALKELNAINECCLSDSVAANDIHLNIDKLFDSNRDRRSALKKPFDFIFFVDNINERGMVLETTEDYLDLMTTATYMQVYSPVTPMNDSMEDNAILTVISGNGKPMYGGVGSAKLIYPYQDLVDYCGIRATVESITDKWTVFDKEYLKAAAENRRLMALDPTVKELKRSEHFLTSIYSMLEQGNSRFAFIRSAIMDKSDEGIESDRTEDYYEKIYSFVIDKIRDDDEIRLKDNETGVTEKQLKANLSSKVLSCETALKDYLDTINDRIVLLRSSVVQAILPDDFGSVINIDSEWNIRNFVTKQGHIVHPLAARLLLYKLRDKLVTELGTSRAVTASQLKRINDYFKKEYDNINTADITESALDRARETGLIAKGRFISEYLQKSSAQKKRLDKYRDSKIISIVFDDLLTRVDALIAQYERLFDSLDEIKAGLERNVETHEQHKHSNTAKTSSYLCASLDEKRQLYTDLNFSCSDSNENGMYDSIFYSLYTEAYDAVERSKNKNLPKLSQSEKLRQRNETMSKIFNETVLSNNIRDVAERGMDKLDLNIFDALRKDAEHKGMKVNAILESTFDKARPYLMQRGSTTVSLAAAATSPGALSYTLTFWGIDKDVRDEIVNKLAHNDIREFFRAGTKDILPEVVASVEYSRHEISCYQALYCVALTEIPKFSETGSSFGVFYENYANRLIKMEKGDSTATTPHLDIRWHKRSFLPMISGKKNQEDDMRAARALWLAFFYGGIAESSKSGKMILYASFADSNAKGGQKYKSRDISYTGKDVQLNEVYELYKALQADDTAVEQFLDVYETQFAQEKDSGTIELKGPRARRFAKKLVSADNPDRNAINLLARFMLSPKVTDDERGVFTEALYRLMEEFCESLTNKRSAELRKMAFDASRYTKSQTTRAKVSRYIRFADWGGPSD